MKAKGASKESDAKAKKTGTTATMKAASRPKVATTGTQRASTTATRKAATTATRKAATTATRKASTTATRKAVATTATRKAVTTTATRRAAPPAAKQASSKTTAPKPKKSPAPPAAPPPVVELPIAGVPMVDASLPPFTMSDADVTEAPAPPAPPAAPAAPPPKPAREKRAPKPKAAKPAVHEEIVPELPNASSGSPMESRLEAAVLGAPLMAELPLDAPATPPTWSPEVTPLAGGPDVLTMASSSGRLKTFVKAVRDAGLLPQLGAPGPFTVFAPSDRAFSKLSARDLDQLMTDKARLAALIRHHVVDGLVRLRTGATRGATALDGATLTVTSDAETFTVNGARIVQSNIRAANGVIHVIDRVLLPR